MSDMVRVGLLVETKGAVETKRLATEVYGLDTAIERVRPSLLGAGQDSAYLGTSLAMITSGAAAVNPALYGIAAADEALARTTAIARTEVDAEAVAFARLGLEIERLQAEITSINAALAQNAAAYRDPAQAEFQEDITQSSAALQREKTVIDANVRALQAMQKQLAATGNAQEGVAGTAGAVTRGVRGQGLAMTQISYLTNDLMVMNQGWERSLVSVANNITPVVASLGGPVGLGFALTAAATAAVLAKPLIEQFFDDTAESAREAQAAYEDALDTMLKVEAGGRTFTLRTAAEASDLMYGAQFEASQLEQQIKRISEARGRLAQAAIGGEETSAEAERRQEQLGAYGDELESLNGRLEEWIALEELGAQRLRRFNAEAQASADLESLGLTADPKKPARGAGREAEQRAKAQQEALEAARLEAIVDGFTRERTALEAQTAERLALFADGSEEEQMILTAHTVKLAEITARYSEQAKAERERLFNATTELEARRLANAGETEEAILEYRQSRLYIALNAEEKAHGAETEAYLQLAAQIEVIEGEILKAIEARTKREREHTEAMQDAADERLVIAAETAEERARIEEEMADAALDRLAEEMEAERAAHGDKTDLYYDLAERYAEAENRKAKATADRIEEERRAEQRQAREREERMQAYAEAMGRAFSAIDTLLAGLHNAELQRIENEETRALRAIEARHEREATEAERALEAIEAQHDREIEAAERALEATQAGTAAREAAEERLADLRRLHARQQENVEGHLADTREQHAEEAARIEERYQEERREAQRRAAEWHQKAAIAFAIIEGAKQASAHILEPWMIALIAAGVAAQIAVISSTEIPEFAVGVTGFRPNERTGSLAVVGERGREIVTLPTGANVITNENTERLLSAAAQVQRPPPPFAGAFAGAFGAPDVSALRAEIVDLRRAVDRQTTRLDAGMDRTVKATLRGAEHIARAQNKAADKIASRPLVSGPYEMRAFTRAQRDQERLMDIGAS